jgi:hypothetical protein
MSVCLLSYLRLILIDLWYSCAAINGIDPAIISRANEIASLSARGENIVAACAVLSPEEMQDLEEAVRVYSPEKNNLTNSLITRTP